VRAEVCKAGEDDPDADAHDEGRAVSPQYLTLGQVALLLRRSPKTILNMAYAHRLTRHVEPIGRRRRRVFTPAQARDLQRRLRPVKHIPPALKHLP
jgi:hypothetical protein